ncbi:hypothetical protein CS009_01490 [Streptococcus macedonicus]|uniref:Uncharacterized protein n=1 Tax=Streptococcus macedonicus TaxID=59310 RepID=A0AAP8G0P4_STRMC|nr:hypothetical protein [Streptococcus macedonicus]PHV58707.1 hypothetical protein CS009_01490 [Streptococcus macedonicus]
MLTPEELKQRRASLIKELRELDNQIQQAERTLKGLKKATIKNRFKQLLGGLLKLMIWLSFFLARTAFFYYFLHSVIRWSLFALLGAIWLACGSDFLYIEGRDWVQEKWSLCQRRRSLRKQRRSK